jgi:hypothetical protein
MMPIDYHPFDILLVNLNKASFPKHWKIYSNTVSEIDINSIYKHYHPLRLDNDGSIVVKEKRPLGPLIR